MKTKIVSIVTIANSIISKAALIPINYVISEILNGVPIAMRYKIRLMKRNSQINANLVK